MISHTYSHSVFAFVQRPAFQLSWFLPSLYSRTKKDSAIWLLPQPTGYYYNFVWFQTSPLCKWSLHFSWMLRSDDWL